MAVVRSFAIAFLFALSMVAQTTTPQSDKWNNYIAEKSYRLVMTWTGGDSASKNEEQGDCAISSSLNATIQVNVSFKLVRSERGHGVHALWTTEKSSKPQGSAFYSVAQAQHQHSKTSGGSCKTADSVITQSGGGIESGEANFDLNTRTGEFQISGYMKSAQGQSRMEGTGAKPIISDVGGLVFHSTAGGVSAGLAPAITGTATPGGRTLKAQQPIAYVDDSISQTSRKPAQFSWRLEPWEEDKDEMIFDGGEAYDKWIPAPRKEDLKGIEPSPDEFTWKPLRVTVRIVTKAGNTGRSGKIRFTLEDVSKNKGYAINFPFKAENKVDLRFAKEQPDGIDVKGSQVAGAGKIIDVAETKSAVSTATVILESLDPGAYGTLKATSDELNLKAIFKPTNTYALSIPRDDDGNHFADAWEKQKGIPHRDKNWDEENVPGQKQQGDGLTQYQEYRGVVVLENDKKIWRRLDPMKKEMFVLDPDKVFPQALFERISQIKAYRLDDSNVDPSLNIDGRSPLVNFDASDFPDHPVYALRVKLRRDNPSETKEPAFAESALPFCIKNAYAINIVPARVVSRINEDYDKLNKAILDPDGVGKWLASPPDWLGSGFAQDAKTAWSKMVTPASRQAVVIKLQNSIFLHEMSHILGTPDHKDNPPAFAGRQCLMFNQGPWTRMATLIYAVIGRGDPDLAYPYTGFCKKLAPGWDCFGVLHVKDW